MHQKERFQNNYDFLRIFAALCIMLTHSFSLLNKDANEPMRILTGGRVNFSFIGLSIFFSISGYLIAKSAIRSSSLKNYLWKRVLRIQPLLILTCLLTVLFIGPFFTHLYLKDYFFNRNTWSYFRNILPVFGIQFTLPGVFTNNIAEAGVNGSLWTLIVEERLYLLMCFIFLLRKDKAMYLSLFIGLLNIFYMINRFFFDSMLITYFGSGPFFYALIFLNSSALFFMNINFTRYLYYYIIIGAFLFLISANFPVLDFLYFLAIPILVNSIAQIKGVTNRAGKFGDFTYGIYVFAFPVQQMLISSKAITNSYELFFYTFILVVPLAVLSWHLVEKRFLSLKRLIK